MRNPANDEQPVVTDGASSAGGSGLDRSRIAELIVTCRSGRRHGSGYRVTANAVLTAAHVVEDAESVQVWFEPDLPSNWAATAVSWWADPGSDLAIISIPSRPGEGSMTPARYGRIGTRAVELSVQAVGFPLWKLRNRDGTVPRLGDGKKKFRDACHAVGSVAPLSNWREGTLEFAVAAPPGRGPDSRTGEALSPWAGMSGAALWASDRIVGVVAKHHPGDGSNRLAAARLDRALDGLHPARGAELRALVEGLPEHSELLHDVLPLQSGQMIVTAYQEQLAAIAPDQLQDRDAELDELMDFCAGEAPYAWWQAGPWAGKSALLSWFALHPPAGVDVVSFFITSRFAGQSDSLAFTDALIVQLTALVGEPPQAALDSRGARHGNTLRLLRAAAQRCEESGRRLLLVVDGLDEDTSTATGLPSIASLLPRNPPPQVRVVVASRPHPGGVPGDHPLWTITPRQLRASPHAHHMELAAKYELSRLLQGAALPREIIGLITASRGGLTGLDLEALTEQPTYVLDGLLGGMLGRIIGARVSPAPALERDVEQVYLFTHETLRETAEQLFGSSLAGYLERLYVWARAYRTRGWPVDTPMYLIRGYPRVLAEIGDIPRLLSGATDGARHDRMFEMTGGDSLALTEIAATTGLILQQDIPDLAALILLARARDGLDQRNDNVPAGLPAAWLTLGKPARAIALANSSTDPARRAQAFILMVAAASRAGDHDRARQLAIDAEQQARQIIDPQQRSNVLISVVQAVIEDGKYDRALRLTHEIIDPSRRVNLLIQLIEAATTAGDGDHALQLATEAEQQARKIIDPTELLAVLRRLVPAVTAAGDYGRALGLTHVITDAYKQASLMVSMVEAMAAAGDLERALQLATEAEQQARKIIDPKQRSEISSGLVWVLSAAGDRARCLRLASDAEQQTRQITDYKWRSAQLGVLAQAAVRTGGHDRALRLYHEIDPIGQAWLLSNLVEAMVTAGDHDRARQLATDAEQQARQITDPWLRDLMLHSLIRAVTAAGDHDRALHLTHEITDPVHREHTLRVLVAAATTAGDHDRALHLIHEITDPLRQADLLIQLVEAATTAGDGDGALQLAGDAEQQARQITHPKERVGVLIRLVEAMTAAGNHGRAVQLAGDVEQQARQITDPWLRAQGLNSLVVAVAEAGDNDRANRIIREIIDPSDQASALSRLAWVVAAAGDHDRALRLMHEITDPDQRGIALINVVGGLTDAGDHNHALHLTREITDAGHRAHVLSRLVEAMSAAGDRDRALQLATEVEQQARQITNPGGRASALCGLLSAVAAAGGDRGRALRLASDAEQQVCQITDPQEQSNVLSQLVQAVTATGDYDRALRLTHEITGPSQRAYALSALVEAANAVGDHEHALRLANDLERQARQIPDPAERENALSSVALAVEAVGDHHRALRLTHEVTDPWRRNSAIGRLVGAAAAAGDHDRALRLTHEITGPLQRAYALSDLVEAANAVGDHDRARQLATDAEQQAHQITDPGHRANALSSLAQAVTATGDHDRARQLIAENLATTAWWRELHLVAQLDAAALLAVCDALLADPPP